MLEQKIKTFPGLSCEAVSCHLAKLDQVRAGLVGSLGLDAYWKSDMTQSRLSLETPHFPLPIVEERYSPGAGGNVAANLAALRPRSVAVLDVLGRDWRGDILIRELDALGIDTFRVIRHPGRVTNAYIKPCRRGFSDVEYEDPRLDFINRKLQSKDIDEAMLAGLDELAATVDVLCVSDQFEFSCLTAPVQKRLVRLAKDGLTVVVDSRSRIGQFPGCFLKPNEKECAAAVGAACGSQRISLSAAGGMAADLARRTGSPVCMTLGPRGCLLAEGEGGVLTHVPSVRVSAPIDICGAGDTFMATFACLLKTGTATAEAAWIANLAAATTVKKINQTGAASREEIMAKCKAVSGQ